MGHLSRRNVVDVTFLLFFSMNFQYQPIRCTDLIEVKNYFFSPFSNWLCQVPAYLLCGSILKYTRTECKNRDPIFGFQVSRSHLERGEREGCPIHTNRFQWNSNQSTGIPLVKCTSLRRLAIGFRLSGGAFYSSIGTIGTYAKFTKIVLNFAAVHS